GEVLVGGLGGVFRYRDTNPFVTDYSLNVTNSKAVREMHRLGAKRVTLSYELNEWQLRDLLATYRAENGGDPALEMIVYGHAPLLVTKYCPLKHLGQCGACRKKQFEIRDDRGVFPLLSHENCDTTVLNGKVLNLLDEMPGIDGVEAFRLNFTMESADEVRSVIAKAQGKLDGSLTESVFDSATDTRGYFNKEIM
ncbi:MAG: U32 family peptidase, partial [Eggerthellaceae bacterium]|nr:U32 family peptidase [Eggerthellaceae bacterium]